MEGGALQWGKEGGDDDMGKGSDYGVVRRLYQQPLGVSSARESKKRVDLVSPARSASDFCGSRTGLPAPVQHQ